MSNRGASRRGADILSAMRPSEQGSYRARRGAVEVDGGRGSAPRRRKALGQHHLKNGKTCRPLVDFLRLAPGERLLEIGPGGGILTRELLTTGASVVAVELDPNWGFELLRRAREFPSPESLSASRLSSSRLSIVIADALELPWERLPVGWRVAGNLPYNVGTVIVERLLRGARPGTRAAFLLQREVVDRMVARPGDDAYGALSVLVAARSRARSLGVVKPGAFTPPPKVDSAFVGLETISPPLPEAAMPAFERLVQVAFGQRRKSLRNALGSGFGREEAVRALSAAGIDPGRRAEELSLDEFRRLFDAFALLPEGEHRGRSSTPQTVE